MQLKGLRFKALALFLVVFGQIAMADIFLAAPTNDTDLVKAVHGRRSVQFVQASGVKVSRILPDDRKGLEHQRWYVRLSDGSEVFAVYNTDITERVPVEVGQTMSLGGEFKWTNQGPLIHWLHEDPRRQRPDGFVEIDGHRYGEVH